MSLAVIIEHQSYLNGTLRSVNVGVLVRFFPQVEALASGVQSGDLEAF